MTTPPSLVIFFKRINMSIGTFLALALGAIILFGVMIGRKTKEWDDDETKQ